MKSAAARSFERVCVVGLGYIGLPTAAVLATRGVQVLGVDVNPDVIVTINRGDVHIEEPDLDIAVRSAVLSGKLRAVPRPEPADAYILAVPTPFGEGHKPDLTYVEAAARAIAPVLARGNLLVLESTSPVGTTGMVAGLLASARPDLRITGDGAGAADVHLAYCPERVLPGRVLTELVENARVIGGLTPEATEAATALYRIFVSGECIATDVRTAEMVKLTENAFRDVNIAFANELSLICDALGIDVWELIALANHHPRVNILQPGPGVGGHCIAVDPWFIVDSAPAQSRLIRMAREVNDAKPGFVVDKVRKALAATGTPVVACLGLAFKPDIDDLRESPALDITRQIAETTPGPVLVVEPHIDSLPPALSGFDNLALTNAEDAIARANVVVLLVNHQVFRTIPRSALAGKSVIDTRGMWR